MSKILQLYESLGRKVTSPTADVPAVTPPPQQPQVTQSRLATAERLAVADVVAVDFETEEFDDDRGISPHNASLVGMSYKERGQPAQYLTDPQSIIRQLNSFGDRPRVYHKALFDRGVELRAGLPQARSFDCTITMARLLDENRVNKLKVLGKQLLGRNVTMYADVDRSDPIAFAQYAAQDAELTLALLDEARLLDQIRQEGLEFVYHQVELPVIDPTITMAQNGVLLDVKKLERLREQKSGEVTALKVAIEAIAGRLINLNSYPQLSRYLYEDLHLPVLRLTKKGQPSTATETLVSLRGAHPVIEVLIQHSEAQDVVERAGELLGLVNTTTNRIHCDLNPLGAKTGRYSSSAPNLQNIPSQLLDFFVASPGHVLLEADFSQIELRVLAHFSRDPGFLDAYCGNDIDIHRRTAALALGLREAEITADQRKKIGKAVNFGIIYGQTEYGLSRKLNISIEEAQKFINGYLQGYPRVAAWIDEIKQFVRLHGFVRTLYGRRRRLPGVWSPERGKAEHALRQAVNSVVQGTAADINKLALVRLHKALPPQVRTLLTIHDSVLLEVPQEIAEPVADMVRQEMEVPPPDFTIPLRVDIKSGLTWGECKRED